MPIDSTCNYSCTLSAPRSRSVRSLRALAAGLWVNACLLLALPFSAHASPGSGACAQANVLPDGANTAVVEGATLCLIDRIRHASGLRSLRANAELVRVAVSQVSSMLRSNYFADVRPTGQTPMTLVGGTRYRAHAADITVGQNIAWGTGADATPAHIVAEWMASPPHRKIMLSSEFRDAGTAVVPALPGFLGSSSRGAIYAVEFGVRR